MSEDGREEEAEVMLSVYALPGTSSLNAMTQLAGLGGAYHVGVVVYWLEWSFGWAEMGSGVYAVFPATSTIGTYDSARSVRLGKTPKTPREVLRILEKMRREWLGPQYNLLRRNCAHFSVELVGKLEVDEAPSWVNSLAGTGEAIVGRLGLGGAEAAAADATPAVELRRPPEAAEFSEDTDSEEADEVVMRERIWRQAQKFVLDRAAAVVRAARQHEATMELQWGTPPAGVSPAKVAASRRALRDDIVFFEVLADATALGMGLRGDGRVRVLSVWPATGDVVRCRVLFCGSSDEDFADEDWPPPVPSVASFASLFARGVRAALREADTSAWLQYAELQVAGMTALSPPGGQLFGERVETSRGPGGLVVHSSAFEPPESIKKRPGQAENFSTGRGWLEKRDDKFGSAGRWSPSTNLWHRVRPPPCDGLLDLLERQQALRTELAAAASASSSSRLDRVAEEWPVFKIQGVNVVDSSRRDHLPHMPPVYWDHLHAGYSLEPPSEPMLGARLDDMQQAVGDVGGRAGGSSRGRGLGLGLLSSRARTEVGSLRQR